MHSKHPYSEREREQVRATTTNGVPTAHIADMFFVFAASQAHFDLVHRGKSAIPLCWLKTLALIPTVTVNSFISACLSL